MIHVIIPEKKKRSRWLWLTGALFLFVVLAVMAWNLNLEGKKADPLTAVERAWLKAHPVIRLAPDPDFPPVEYYDRNGAYQGITADYVALIEKKLGIHLEIVRLRNWDEIISKAKSRKIDAYVATKTPQRVEYLLFTRPFLEFPVVIIAREKVKGPLTLEKLTGMKISAVSNYAAHNFIAYNYPKLHLDLTPDVQTGLRKVAFGQSDAFVENLATASYYIEKEGITNLRIAGESGYFYRMGFCTRKDWPELNRILEKGLAAISADQKKAMYKKWIPMEPRSLFISKEFQTGLLAAFAMILLIVAVIIAWNRSLTRQVRLRTGELENELAERRRTDEELARARDGLEVRVVERTRELAETVQALRFTQFTVDRSVDQAFWMTHDGHFFYVNDAACQALGYTRDELVTMSVQDIDPTCPPERVVHYWHVLRENGTDTFETCHRAKDGRVYPVEIRSNLLTFDGKEYNCCLATDITERKRMEEDLLLSHFCIGKAAIGIFQISLDDGKILHVNDSACRSLGYSSDELCTMNVLDIDTSLTWKKFIEIRSMEEPSGSITFETVHRRKDGTTFPVEITANTLEFQGMSTGFSFAKDITVRKRAEQALRESESCVRRKLESILDPEGDIGELDLADILDAPEIQALMDDLYRITGIKMSIIDLKGRLLADVGWQDICLKFHRKHPETLKNCLKSDTDLTVGVPQGEFKTYRCENNLWHIVTPIIIGERHMGNLFMGQFFFANEQIDYDFFRSQARRYGFPEEEYIEALEAMPRHSEELVNMGKAVFLRLTDIFSKLSYANIKLAHSLAERDQLTETLSKANLVVENSPVVLFRWKGDDEWPVELVSRNIIQFGYNPDEFLSGSTVYSSILHPDDLKRVTREVHDFCNDGTDQFRLEYRIKTKGGEIRWVNELSNIERDAAGGVKNFEGIIIDVTERKRAEEELQRQKQLLEKLNDTLENRVEEEVAKNREKDIMLIQQNRQAALGEMLDHIAHQWKQPLTSLSLVIQDLGDTASAGQLTPELTKETVCITMALLDHMTQTMDVFRGFYRPDKEKKVFNIKDSIDQAIAFIAPALSFHSIAVELDVDPGLTAFGYPKEYAQVLLNILANARDVFRKRGTEKPRVMIRAFAEVSKSVVTVTDNAGGIPEAIIDKIFDFYFTTNESIGGTGIGLYMSKKIIEKNMGGTLRAENTNGGAQFRIEIKES
ncbi:MAG: PAS domain S-box protein [Geobacter sp.]|nr:MAG: PAS domain S-box protein [Geobacter sp.]